MNIVPLKSESRDNSAGQSMKKLEELFNTNNEYMKKLESIQSRLQKNMSQYRKQLKKSRDKQKRKELLVAMGKLSGHISHQLRNPLGSLELFASLLKKRLEEDNEKKCLVENILISTEIINQHIENMLNLTKPLNPTFVLLSIPMILDETLHHARHLAYQKQVLIKRNYMAKYSGICGDPDLLRQLFLNLILNSLQAIQGEGQLSCSVYSGSSWTRSPMKGVIVEIEDTGKGIPAEFAERVWEPFFTSSKKGLGFGMAVAFRIVDVHGGDIELESRESKGTTVRIFLPENQRCKKKYTRTN